MDCGEEAVGCFVFGELHASSCLVPDGLITSHWSWFPSHKKQTELFKDAVRTAAGGLR
jgi:hypothetical protein